MFDKIKSKYNSIVKNFYLDPVPTRASMDLYHATHSDPSVRQSKWPDRLFVGIYIVLGFMVVFANFGVAINAF